MRRIVLSGEVTDQIIFAMENQEESFYFDLQEGMVLTRGEIIGEEIEQSRYLSIPTWSSAQGFQLMERFTAGLKNPLYRQELGKALSSGRGVFRKFKDVLHQYAPLEKLWYGFKEKEMRREVKEWFSRHLDALELESLGPEPEETEDLLLSDFPVRFQETDTYLEGDEEIEKVIDELCEDGEGQITASLAFREYLFDRMLDLMDSSDCSGRIIAETPEGQLAGVCYLTAFKGSDGSVTVFFPFLHVEARFRGLGLAKTLMERALQEAGEWGAAECVLELPGAASVLSSSLEEMGFSFWSGTYRIRKPR